MGIPRWTQDLTPYLETAVITNASHQSFALNAENVVIDGPSMVYHVYSALTKPDIKDVGSFSIPTYRQLNAAVDVFLSDLESCGAKIDHILFDGALPVSKRETRLERLEKSRLQLESVRRLGLTFPAVILPPTPEQEEISRTLWQNRSGSNRSSSLTSPFIVPGVIEYLRDSSWSEAVSVVPGEAEVFCASAAKELGATVLSNDSDLTILDDMQDQGMVGLLHTMNVTEMPVERPSTITVHCWRPAEIKKRLGTKDLQRLAFQRSRDTTASFATILQRSTKDQTKAEAGDLARFVDQFRSPRGSKQSIQNIVEVSLTGLDPRLAELICQLKASNKDTSIFRAPDCWITFPILFEDPSKDASWAYGQNLRQLAYSLLFATFRQLDGATAPVVKESFRKGQRIPQEAVEVIDPAGIRIRNAIRNLTVDLATLSTTPTNTTHKSENHNSRDFILWALASVLRQRTTAGKSIMPSTTIREYLGLTDTNIQHYAQSGPIKKHKPLRPDSEAEWRLIHLNANVHSVLYSLRLLRQSCIFLRDTSTAIRYKDNIVRFLELTETMPPIQDLFLDVHAVRALLQAAPLSREDAAYRYIFPGDIRSVEDPRRSEVGDGTMLLESMEQVVRKKKRRERSESKKTSNVGQQPEQQKAQFSKNPFDLLTEGG